MTANNDITGDRLVSKPATQNFLDNFDQVFKQKKRTSGQYIQHPKTGKLVDKEEYYQENPKPKPKAYFKGAEAFEAFQSPATDEIVTTERKRQDDMKKSGCREYEGFETENQEVQRHRQYEQEALDNELHEGIRETFEELKNKQIKPETKIDTGWITDE